MSESGLERLNDRNYYLHEGQVISVEISTDYGSCPKNKPNPESLEVFQYVQISKDPLPREVIIGRIRETGDLVNKNSEQYYMERSASVHSNCILIEESLRDYHGMGGRSKSQHPSRIVTSCSYSECYGLCGRRECLDSTKWKKK
jgi:hypothetical protein